MAIDLSGRKVGLVLAGAVAQGAFEAGALSMLAGLKPNILAVAGTSSGALNAAIVAAGIAAGRFAQATDVLKKLWVEHGSWTDIEKIRLSDWFHVRGLFTTDRVRELVLEGLQNVVGESSGAADGPAVTLTLVTTNLDGAKRTRHGAGAVPLPTFEQPLPFKAEALRTRAQWPSIALAAAASATFPGLFSPTLVGGHPCIDGGAVNNAPISYILDEPRIDTVIVVTTESSQLALDPNLGGKDLVAKVAEAVIEERVAYDLAAAHAANQRYKAVAGALDALGLPQPAKDSVLKATGYRPVDLYLIRPEQPLTGDSFSGFFDRSLREGYVKAGESARLLPIS